MSKKKKKNTDKKKKKLSLKNKSESNTKSKKKKDKLKPTLKKKKLKAPKQKPKQAKKLRKVYKKQRCAFHDKDGKRCRCNAYGKSSLCKKHGGKIDSKELISYNDLDPSATATTKFDPAYHPMKFIALSKQGMSEVECAAYFNVSIQTLRGWSEKFSDFAMAYDVGKVVMEAYYVAVGRDNFENTRFNTSLFKFITGNQFGWSDKVESKSTNMNLHGVLVIPSEQTEEDWEKETVQQQEEAKRKAKEIFKDALMEEGDAIDAEFKEV